MKKISYLFVIITSLFLSFNSVKAYTAIDTYIENFDFINDDFFEVKNQAEFISNDIGYNYYLIKYLNDFFEVYFFNDPETYTTNVSYSSISVVFTNSGTIKHYNFIDNVLTYSGNSSAANIFINRDASTGYFLFNHAIYTNYYIEWNHSFDYIFRYNDYVFTTTLGDQFLTLYDYYLLINPQPDPHEEEKNIILNFYTLIIDKLSFLSESFSSNYIYLSVIVVFILIFIIELIRRHL